MNDHEEKKLDALERIVQKLTDIDTTLGFIFLAMLAMFVLRGFK